MHCVTDRLTVDTGHSTLQPPADKPLGSGAGRGQWLSVCSWCNMARDKRGVWAPMHTLLLEHPELTQTHGVCPECIKKHFPNRVSVA